MPLLNTSWSGSTRKFEKKMHRIFDLRFILRLQTYYFLLPFHFKIIFVTLSCRFSSIPRSQ